ncbi:MAG: chromate transporter [Clostridia bacterium]|nr:chromate transporter [Clostridia bacterium]
MLMLFLKFVYCGFVAFGGGLATIPILYNLFVESGMVTEELFYNMVSISQSTPGPIGLNLATYTGYSNGGIIGAVLASLGIITSSVICVSIIVRIYNKVKDNKYVIRIFGGVKAAFAGVILAAFLKILKNCIFTNIEGLNLMNVLDYMKYIDYKSIILVAIIFALITKFKGPMVRYIALGAVIGIFVF